MRVNYIYKKESDGGSFTSIGSNTELKEYMSNLVFYSPLNDLYRAEYALYDKVAKFDKKPEVFTGGPFGSYLKIIDRYSFDIKNFDSIENNIRISFYLGSNKLVNSSTIGLRKKDNFPKDGLPKGDYSLTVNVEGQPTSTMILKLKDNSTVKQIKNNILFNLDPVIYPYELNTSNNEPDLIVIQSLYEGKVIKITDGLDGVNLLDYFNVEPVEFGSAPNFDNTIFRFRNLTIKHVRNTIDGNAKSYLRFIISGNEDQQIEIPWNNDAIHLDNIEIDIDDNLIYIYLNGKVKVVEVLKNKLTKNDTTLILSGDNNCQYSFDELIINKACIHTKEFELDRNQLTKYSTKKPYIDYYFDGKSLKKGMALETASQSGIHCCLCDDGNYYYYNAGEWRPASGNFNNTNDWYTFSEKIKLYDFSGNEIFIRCFFVSDGVTVSYLDVPYFKMEDEEYIDKNGNTSAILIGTKEWSLNGEPLKEDLTGKVLTITTDKGTSSIEFEPGYKTLDEIIEEINNYYPEGIIECSKDGEDRAMLISETKGKEAFITVSGSAAPIIFGDAGLSASGKDANAGTIDYTKFYDAVRTYTSKILLSEDEISDEQMRLFLKEALAYYKKWKGDEINQYTCQLKGNWEDGWEIPSIIENQRDIVDIIFRPIFPITFYGSDFIDNGSENIFALTLAESLFGGRGAVKNGQGITQDYYISLMGMQDFRQTLGLNPSWEILNNRIYIFPSQVARFTYVAIKYKAPLSEEDCLNDPDIIKYVHGKCLMTLGNVRGQYGAQFAFGENQLTFNADQLYERGKMFVDEVLETWKKQQPVYGFFLG